MKSKIVFLLVSLVLLNGLISAGFGKNGVLDAVDLMNTINLKDQWGILICSSQLKYEKDENFPREQMQIQLNMGDQFLAKICIESEISRIQEVYKTTNTPYQVPFFSFSIGIDGHPPQLLRLG